jgi:hypothetical protein
MLLLGFAVVLQVLLLLHAGVGLPAFRLLVQNTHTIDLQRLYVQGPLVARCWRFSGLFALICSLVCRPGCLFGRCSSVGI